MDALKPKLVTIHMHAKRLSDACWDALGQSVFVELVSGPPEVDRLFRMSMRREAAEQLHRALGALLADTAGEEETRQ